MDEPRRYLIDTATLPVGYPTHRLSPDFWEALGRAVTTFGFLEDVLGRAIFAFTAKRSYPEDEIQPAYQCWVNTLQHALSDPLGNLIKSYEEAVRD